MSRVDADVEAITLLRNALLAFGDRERVAIEQTEMEIARTDGILEDAERHWRNELERRAQVLHECFREAAYAAREGGHVDCSRQEFAVAQAEEQLAQVIQWR